VRRHKHCNRCEFDMLGFERAEIMEVQRGQRSIPHRGHSRDYSREPVGSLSNFLNAVCRRLHTTGPGIALVSWTRMSVNRTCDPVVLTYVQAWITSDSETVTDKVCTLMDTDHLRSTASPPPTCSAQSVDNRPAVGGRLAVPAFPLVPPRLGQGLPLHRCRHRSEAKSVKDVKRREYPAP